MSAGLLIKGYSVNEKTQVSQALLSSPVAKLQVKGVFLAHIPSTMAGLSWALEEYWQETVTTIPTHSPHEFDVREIHLDDPANRACRVITAQTEEPPNEAPQQLWGWQANRTYSSLLRLSFRLNPSAVQFVSQELLHSFRNFLRNHSYQPYKCQFLLFKQTHK